MKLNVDCLRDVLLTMQDMPRGETLSGNEIRAILDEYDEDDVDYSCLKLKEAGYIDAIIKEIPSGFIVLRLDDITFLGHQFIANIQSDSVWNDVKAISSKIGSQSISALTQIATSVISTIIKSQLGLI